MPENKIASKQIEHFYFLQTMVTSTASLLDHNPHHLHYWSADPCDIPVGAHLNSLSLSLSLCACSKFSGFSINHPMYNEDIMT
mmetsp:Transcript_14329/g.38152  ORF Transcript_14329/g.38152 Transcript_14329/m.38152 type:complete len:83 (-) Transcript_14329:1116-1364(-)